MFADLLLLTSQNAPPQTVQPPPVSGAAQMPTTGGGTQPSLLPQRPHLLQHSSLPHMSKPPAHGAMPHHHPQMLPHGQPPALPSPPPSFSASRFSNSNQIPLGARVGPGSAWLHSHQCSVCLPDDWRVHAGTPAAPRTAASRSTTGRSCTGSTTRGWAPSLPPRARRRWQAPCRRPRRWPRRPCQVSSRAQSACPPHRQLRRHRSRSSRPT